MKLKSIFIVFLLLQFLFSESNFSIQLNNKKALRFSFGISQWESNDNIGAGLWLSYISKPPIYLSNLIVCILYLSS